MTFKYIVFGALGLSLISGSALAKESDVILVTGVRTPIALDEMSTAVTVISSEDLARRQSFQLVDVLRDVPGMSVARSGPSGSQAQIRMRGTEANHVLVLIDGVEVNDPASGDEFLFEHLTASEIERVEIIRGPQSALWGSDAVAGVINIVTRKGDGDLSGILSVEAGSFETKRASGSVRDGGEVWRLNLGVSFSESEGTNVSRVGDEDDGYENLTLQGNLSFDLTPTTSLDFTARRVDSTNDFDPVDWGTGLPSDGDRVGEAETTVFGARMRFDPHDGKWVHKIGVNFFESDNVGFSDGVESGSTSAERMKYSFETTYAFSDAHRATFAIDHEETDFAQTGEASIYGDPNHEQFMTVTGYVLDYVGELSDALTVTSSMRYDDNSDFDNVTTWRLGASFDVTSSTRFRASAGRGQKAPSFIDRFGFMADTFIGNPNIQPETSKGFELGIEQTLSSDRARMSLTYFQSELENEIDGFFYDADLLAFTAVNKDGFSERRGVEATLDVDLHESFSLSANYTYTDSDEPDPLGGTRKELRRPEHVGGVVLDYEAENGGGVNLSLSYVGDAKDIFFPPYPLPSEIVTLGSYTLVGVAARYPLSDKVTLTGRVENALDATYEDVFGFATPGIAGYIGLKARF